MLVTYECFTPTFPSAPTELPPLSDPLAIFLRWHRHNEMFHRNKWYGGSSISSEIKSFLYIGVWSFPVLEWVVCYIVDHYRLKFVIGVGHIFCWLYCQQLLFMYVIHVTEVAEEKNHHLHIWYGFICLVFLYETIQQFTVRTCSLFIVIWVTFFINSLILELFHSVVFFVFLLDFRTVP